jgi:hypothetical protein
MPFNSSVKKITLTKDDAVNKVISVLRQASEDRIEIFIPEKAQIFRNGLNFQLIKDEAARLNKEVVVETPDDWGQKTVRVMGISLKESDVEKIQEVVPEDLAKKGSEGQRVSDIGSYEKKSVLRGGKQLPKFLQEKKSSVDIKQSLSGRKKRGKLLKTLKRPQVKFPKLRLSFGFLRVFKQIIPVKRRAARWSYKKAVIFFIVAVVVVAFLVVYFLLPSAQVIIEPRRVNIPIEMAVRADASLKEPDLANNLIPAQLISVERVSEKTYKATGQEEVSNPARGIIAVFNAYSSEPQILVGGTRFLSKEGKLFCLVDRITVPGAKIVEGKITLNSIDAWVYSGEYVNGRCQEAIGEKFNIGPSEFIIPGFQGSPKFNGFYGRSENSMTGGFEGVATVISEEDLNKAKEDFDSQTFGGLRKELLSQVPSNLEIIDGAVVNRKTEEEISNGVGDAVKSFIIKAKLVVAALIFDPGHLELLFETELEGQMTDQQFIENQGEFEFGGVAVDLERNRINFNALGDRILTSRVNAEVLVKKLLGKDESQIREILIKEPSVESARLKLVPFWLKNIPDDADKIEVIVK